MNAQPNSRQLDQLRQKLDEVSGTHSALFNINCTLDLLMAQLASLRSHPWIDGPKVTATCAAILGSMEGVTELLDGVSREYEKVDDARRAAEGLTPYALVEPGKYDQSLQEWFEQYL